MLEEGVDCVGRGWGRRMEVQGVVVCIQMGQQHYDRRCIVLLFTDLREKGTPVLLFAGFTPLIVLTKPSQFTQGLDEASTLIKTE